MPSRDMVVDKAIWEATGSSWFPEDHEMVAFFKETGQLYPPSAKDLEKFHTMKSNVMVGTQSIAWCGIFACYVLKHWGGYGCKWVSGDTGITGGGIVKNGKADSYTKIKPGDVCVIRNSVRTNKTTGAVYYLHHHYIVTAVNYAKNTHSYVEGNGADNKIWYREDKPIEQPVKADNFYKRPYCVYQLPA